MSLFSVSFANYSVTPILKENYGRFGDIAQGDANAFLIQSFSGVDPMVAFTALGLIFLLGWFGIRASANSTASVLDAGPNRGLGEETKNAGETMQPQIELIETERETEAAEHLAGPMEPDNPEETQEIACEADSVPDNPEDIKGYIGTDPALITSRGSVFSAFPDAKKVYLYATLMAGALVILMLEVVFR